MHVRICADIVFCPDGYGQHQLCAFEQDQFPFLLFCEGVDAPVVAVRKADAGGEQYGIGGLPGASGIFARKAVRSADVISGPVPLMPFVQKVARYTPSRQ